MVSVILIVGIVWLTGCGRPVVIVPAGEPVQLAEETEARVWVVDSEGKLVKSRKKKTIPQGWWALPDPGPSEDAREESNPFSFLEGGK